MSRRHYRPGPEHVLKEIVGHALERELERQKERYQRRQRRRRRRRGRGTFGKIVRMVLMMLVATFVLLPAMISAGVSFGAHWAFLLGPVIFVATYGAIVWWVFRHKDALPSPKVIVETQLAQLPGRTDDWLEAARPQLPEEAGAPIESLQQQLDSLAPQLEGLDPQQPAAVELRRLLAEELPELVRGYQRVPRKLQQQASHGGTTPERQLIDGLDTIDKQLTRIHERLAAEDLRALATQQRYLELKYKGDKLE